MTLRSQLRKGILEGCILSLINREMIYGYELSVKLRHFGLNHVSEGSIYPILLRLQKEKLIVGKLWPSPTGPKRKYYRLTSEGKAALQIFIDEWQSIQQPVKDILTWGNKL